MNKVRRYQWQGEAVDVVFGYCLVTENKDKPMYWYNYNVFRNGQLPTKIGAIRVDTSDGQSFCLSNDYGEGVHKLESGGYPNMPHRSLPSETFVESEDFRYKTTIYRPLIAYHEEVDRRQYFMCMFPEEFKKSEALRNKILRANKKYNA